MLRTRPGAELYLKKLINSWLRAKSSSKPPIRRSVTSRLTWYFLLLVDHSHELAWEHFSALGAVGMRWWYAMMLHQCTAETVPEGTLMQVLSRLDKESVQTTKAIKEQHAAELNALKEEHTSALAQVLSNVLTL